MGSWGRKVKVKKKSVFVCIYRTYYEVFIVFLFLQKRKKLVLELKKKSKLKNEQKRKQPEKRGKQNSEPFFSLRRQK